MNPSLNYRNQKYFKFDPLKPLYEYIKINPQEEMV